MSERGKINVCCNPCPHKTFMIQYVFETKPVYVYVYIYSGRINDWPTVSSISVEDRRVTWRCRDPYEGVINSPIGSHSLTTLPFSGEGKGWVRSAVVKLAANKSGELV